MRLDPEMRILLLSDVHSNLAALDAVIQAAYPFEQVWCLGDIVGYGPEPNACLERLRGFDLISLAGNHDLAAVGKLSLEDFSDDARAVVRWTRDRLSAENIEWLKSLPTLVVLEEHSITLVHGSPRDPIWEYIVTPETAWHCLQVTETPLCFYGHTHVPRLYRKPTLGLGVAGEELIVGSPIPLELDRMLINPGSVGQPRDDDPRAAFAILDTEKKTLLHQRVRYDMSVTQRLMKQAHLPDRLIRRLRHGE